MMFPRGSATTRSVFPVMVVLSAVLLGGCGGVATDGGGPGGDGTLYLQGLQGAHTLPRPAVRGLVDNVSYWDGDGVAGEARVTIDLSQQRAFFYKGQRLVGVSRISSGNRQYPTPTGSFKVTQKNKDHRSNLYGDFVDHHGRPVIRDVEAADIPPPGLRFLGASMPNFMRFNKGVGMHAGFLPGYPASHGCVRMPERMSEHFYRNVGVGTPVVVVD